MKVRASLLFALFAGMSTVMLAAASSAQSGGGPGAAGNLRIYGPGELSVSQYEVVGRLWIDSWRTAFWLPTFASADEAIEALKTEAATRGAEGLVNVFCLDQGHWAWSTDKGPAYLCYGTAIRVRPGRG